MAVDVKQKSGIASKVVRRSAIHLLSFGYVAGRMKSNNISFQDAIGEFLAHFDLDEINPESLEREMRRMTVEYLQEGI